MNLRKSKPFATEVYTASLNDIMFFLLLFFLIVSTLANPSVVKLLLPKSQSSQSITKQQLIVSVTKDKTYFVNNDPVLLEQLESTLKTKMKTDDPTIVLRMDNGLSVQDLVDVLQIGNNLKAKMVLATKIEAN